VKYRFKGNSKYVIVDGKVYEVKGKGKEKYVEIPKEVDVPFLEPVEKPKKKKKEPEPEGEK